MADRDEHYRGYGSPSGRYYENREYDQGYDRSRDRGERGERGGSWFGGDDRNRERGRDDSWFGGSRDRSREDWRGSDRSRGGDDGRGFFERAGEEIRSWFSDDDDRGGRYGRDEYRGQSRDRGSSWGGMNIGGNRGSYDRDDRPPQTFRGEPTSGGYDYGRSEWRGRSGGYEAGGSRYGATSGYGAGSSRNQYSGGGAHPHDDHYREWRNQQIGELDRDYEEYRRENRDKFHNEFSSWRGQRQQQRSSLRQAKEHMEVVGSDGQPVGTVDKVVGDKIILTKNGANAGGHHHSIPCSWIQSVDERVTINKTAEQARQQWTDEENRRALFESDEQRNEDGPHILDRSFSGTYENR
ncbi:DUF2171 domain-containing protein [Sphingomonas sp. ID1715]|uniref:DUF2171 domain-containing protein n=1 Tax=Sphingomonas sp. ID1715 TaxID=1656898 RepID=UPI001489A473|nr:DUF2171 domain-containing protein [Sphingomonas sp. ID1715]NNM76204.1 DUF2171 domain-containing protein [Sphingomonas sp. ID1715]